MGIDHLLNAGVDDHLGATEAGRKRGIERSPLDVDPVIGRLNDGIFLRVGAEAGIEVGAGDSDFVTARTAPLIAVFNAARGAVVAGGNNPLVLDEQSRHFSFDAIGAKSYMSCDLHEIIVPIGAFDADR